MSDGCRAFPVEGEALGSKGQSALRAYICFTDVLANFSAGGLGCFSVTKYGLFQCDGGLHLLLCNCVQKSLWWLQLQWPCYRSRS